MNSNTLTIRNSEIIESLREAIRFIDEAMSIGDHEQKCIISLKFAELNEHTQKKEKLFSDNREFFLNIESLVDSINENETLKKDTLVKKLCNDLNQKAELLKLQIAENMSILNQIKSFFAKFLVLDPENKSYNTFGKFEAPQSKKCSSLISRKV